MTPPHMTIIPYGIVRQKSCMITAKTEEKEAVRGGAKKSHRESNEWYALHGIPSPGWPPPTTATHRLAIARRRERERDNNSLVWGRKERRPHQGCAAAVEAPPGKPQNMARTGRRTSLLAPALALLGLQQGAWALPSSKVAFLQHGLAEGEDAVMHAPPAGSSSRLSAITPQLLSSAIARVMSLDARAEVDTGLPAGDIFNRPDANVLVFVDGLRPTGADFFRGRRWRRER